MRKIFLKEIISLLVLVFFSCGGGEENKPENTEPKREVSNTIVNTPAKETKVIKGDIPYKFSSAQKQAVEKVLTEYKDWRIAVASDSKQYDMIDFMKENPGYEPYFARGDMNEDGKEDFAIVLAKNNEYLLVWFNGDTEDYKNYQVIESGMLDTDSIFPWEKGIICGPVNSDNYFVFKWDPIKKMLVFSEEDSYQESDEL